VVPGLRGIVEDLGLAGLAGSLGNDLFKRQAGEVRAGHQLVQRIDIALVMLAVMESDRLRGDHGIQRVFRVGQRRQNMRRGIIEVGNSAH
jgi:hypothetical protein